MEIDVASESYFALLPNEILLKILRYMDIYDIVKFCDTFPKSRCFISDRVLNNIINLSKDSVPRMVPNFSEFMKRLNLECIKVFNITNVYWVPAMDIRRCLKKMMNLEELHLVGTRVGTLQADCESYRSPKLKKLAVTVEMSAEALLHQYLPNLNSLCIHVLKKQANVTGWKFIKTLEKLECLKELWIDDYSEMTASDITHVGVIGAKLDIFVFKTTRPLCLPRKFLEFTRIFLNEKTGTEVYFANLDHQPPHPRTLAKSSGWIVLNELRAETPYGLQDAKTLIYQETDINEIFFEELNFSHYQTNCCPRYITAIKEILSTKNSSKLRSLAITNCIFSSTDSEESPVNVLKKPKFDDIERLLEHHQTKFINNLKNVKVLEISACERYKCSSLYQFIWNFSKLTQLILEVPSTLNGKFMKEVFEHCTLIDTIEVKVIGSNEDFGRYFSTHIKSAKNLKILRYENNSISMKMLLSGLLGITSSKIEKLYIKCKYVVNLDTEIIIQLLKKNPELFCFIIIINSAPEKTLKRLREQMKYFSKTPATFFSARKSETYFDVPFTIPQVIRNFIRGRQNVGSLNICEEFYRSKIKRPDYK